MSRRIRRLDDSPDSLNSSFPEELPAQEPWLGRLRYVVVPVIAVLAIAAAIYILQGGGGDSGADSASAQPGASSAVNVAAPSGDAAKTPAPRIGFQAPDFALASLDGTPVKLSDFRGKTVFLNFFASWCPPCRAEMPDVLATYQQNAQANNMVVLAVDMQEESSVVSNYASSVGLTFPIVLDRSGSVAGLYRITAIPTSFFIDKDGVVRDMQIGAMSKDLMLSRLGKALSR